MASHVKKKSLLQIRVSYAASNTNQQGVRRYQFGLVQLPWEYQTSKIVSKQQTKIDISPNRTYTTPRGTYYTHDIIPHEKSAGGPLESCSRMPPIWLLQSFPETKGPKARLSPTMGRSETTVPLDHILQVQADGWGCCCMNFQLCCLVYATSVRYSSSGGKQEIESPWGLQHSMEY